MLNDFDIALTFLYSELGANILEKLKNQFFKRKYNKG